ncbi:Na(+)-dependent bicarbonate transporter BicA [hydrothermal vent metagenome]|uniref:Na(+)-dependent bicarbonate transporter BicA n=1 Tax=hydrothermal vent metagenome TaxID=652676 RepID=A0A3B1DZM5_9ZZZZ
MSLEKKSGFNLLASPKQDFLASIVVFLVALPLCMGIAIASGVPVAAGLITGIVGGLVVGWIAGAPLQVSGPAAGLTVIIFDLVQKHGLEVLGIAVLVCGIIQLIAGLLSYGRWFRAVSPAVIHGMLAGIGVLILSSQFHVMVDDSPKGSGIQNLISIPEAIRKGLPMPKMGTAEERGSLRDFLQQFGALHEQQVQLRELAVELIPKTPQDPDHQDPAHHSRKANFPDLSQLKPLEIKQKELSDKLITLVEQLNSQDLSQTVRNPTKLKVATNASLEEMKTALNDLQKGNIRQVNASQTEIQLRLEKVLGELKNHDWAAKIGWLTIMVLVFWKILTPKKLKLVPPSLVAVVVATVFAVTLKLPVLYVEVPDNLWSEIHFPSLSTLQSLEVTTILQLGVVLAFITSAQTLLCATAVDQMQTSTRTDYDKELAAHGIGNIVCGFLGALPMAGVIVRSSANIEAGGKTRLATILHGTWLLLFVSILAFILRMIPTSTLAAMLVYIGYKLINLNSIRELRKYGWGEVGVYFSTLIMIVCTDLLTGIITGIGLSTLKLLYKFSHLKVRLDIEENGSKSILKMTGAATFIRLPKLAQVLESVPANSELHVDFEHLTHIDHACLDLLMNWAKKHESAGGTLVVDWDSLHADFHNKPYRKLQSYRDSEQKTKPDDNK